MSGDGRGREQDYEVVIVGGRPAGASLAARLGQAGVRVLILDKARFPSRPAVSAPFVLPHTLELLDELGLDESEYAADTPRIRRFVVEFGDAFRAHFRFHQAIAGRQYCYAIDRARLDTCVWRSLARYPSVTAMEGTKLLALLRDERGRVTGVRVQRDDGSQSLEISAGLVVGADGRHSLVAREVGAQVMHAHDETLATAVYYAAWEEVGAYADAGDGGPPDPLPVQIHSFAGGFSVVLMPTADAQTMVLVQGRAADYAALEGNPEAVYERLVRAKPAVWRRLASARRVGPLRGLKRFDNLFRTPHGPGWVLVGDAYHQKDSIDAQGIYDALLGAKLLAEALVRARGHSDRVDHALAEYADAAHAALAPMLEATMQRVQREVYGDPPAFVTRTILRWVLTNPRYARRYIELSTRRRDPSRFLTPGVMLGLALTGAWGRLRSVLSARPDPSDPL